MKTTTKLAAAAAILALGAAPALALPSQALSNQGTAHKPSTPGPNASLPAKAKAYGKLCQGTSKKRSDAAAGTKGTPFSQCVTGMAKAATGKASTAKAACKGVSKTHAKGQHKTAYAICVTGAAKLLRQQHAG